MGNIGERVDGCLGYNTSVNGRTGYGVNDVRISVHLTLLDFQ